MSNKIELKDLEKIMVEYGVVIRAIPYERTSIFEIRHKNKYPNGTIYYDENLKRNMLKVVEKNSQGGKFVITTKSSQSSTIKHWGNPVKFYDTIEDAINSLRKK